MKSQSRLPELHELRHVCALCGHSVLAFRFPGGGELLWDPDARQRRWAAALLPLRERLALPPWSWPEGRPHECPPPNDSPLAERDRRRRNFDLDCSGEGGVP